MENYDITHKYQIRTETLLNLLEVHNHGNHGPFDEGQPPFINQIDRYKWLLKKLKS